MTNKHPVTPPPELVQQWWEEADQDCDRDDPKNYFDYIATQAARWGADQELWACCERLRSKDILEPAILALRTARRPKPPSLKEQALAQTNALLNDPSRALLIEVRETLEMNRRALEALDD